MARADELRLMTRVARLYYDVGLKQPEIATRLRLSQPKVSRLLKSAQDEGIVRISVRAPSGTNPELEEALEQRFGLTEVEIVDISRDDDEAAVRDYCKGQIAHFKIPRFIRFVEEFPMTVTGKLQKFRMREAEVEMRQAEGAKI